MSVTIALSASNPDDFLVIKQTLDKLKMPQEVDGYSVDFGVDHSGDPAVWVHLLVTGDDDQAFPKSRLEALSKFTNKVRIKLLDQNIKAWPYVNLHAG